eukprot:GFUD01065871.1.p1 GENE.GFUD01065871.1~~GFUD01065871.1.p1  ORF type:complete len:112 (-),score=16.06 GFUD01065871.1:272-580(-)
MTASTVPTKIGGIVNTAKKLWELVKPNTAVANIQSGFANGIPNGTTLKDARWAGWNTTKSKQYEQKSNTWFRITACKHQWNFDWTYNGSLNGKGKYVARATT